MKAVCVNNDRYSNLTLNKIYSVIYSYHYNIYFLKNDIGHECWTKIDAFKTLDEIREEKLNELLK